MKILISILIVLAVLLGAYFVYTHSSHPVTVEECQEKGGRVVTEFSHPVYAKMLGTIKNDQGANICVI